MSNDRGQETDGQEIADTELESVAGGTGTFLPILTTLPELLKELPQPGCSYPLPPGDM